MVHPRTFFDITVNNESLGRIIFELHNDTAPMTCENFRTLCTGEKGLSMTSSSPLYYKNSTIHRSIKDFMIQGGDFTKFNGTGGESIYGSTFADEDLTRPLDSEALLCMANKGPDTNSSQFFITLRECPHLNGKHVVFGRVIRGYDIVEKIASLPVDAKNRPLTPIVISNCGELELRKQPAKITKLRSTSPERDKRHHSRHSRSPSQSRSRSRSRERGRRHRRKVKRRKTSSEDEDPADKEMDKSKPLSEPSKAPAQETEEEYDARLEREEKERLEAQRKKQLEEMKEKYENHVVNKDGVRYKGRGRMKFVDPETNRRRQ